MFHHHSWFRILTICLLGACSHGRNAPHADGSPAHHWGYEGNAGPTAWGQLSHDYHACTDGSRQSPIDIDVPLVEAGTPPELAFHYQPSTVVESNNGHTLVDTVAHVDTIDFDHEAYQLEQFHFHHVSEHSINGANYPMEVHLVHKSASNKLLVIAVFVREGAAHLGLAPLLTHLPTGDEHVNAMLDVATLLPSQRAYVEYAGSLTTPPCTENVTWVVMTNPITASRAQIDSFAAMFPHNNRPTMPLHARHVVHSTP